MEFDARHINDLSAERDRILLEIADKVDANDEGAIDLYAQEMATDICRAAFRDLAANIKKTLGDQVHDADCQKLAEETLPQTDAYRECVSDLKARIHDALRMIGKET